MDDDDKKTFAEVLADLVLSGKAEMEFARLLGERTGDPLLLEAFRKVGYRVTRVENPRAAPHEVERQKRFGEEARRLAETVVEATPDPKSFAERYIHRLFKKSARGDAAAARDFAELTDGPAEWRIEKNDE